MDDGHLGRAGNGSAHETTTGHAASVLAELLGHQPTMVSDLLSRGDAIEVPFLITDAAGDTHDHKILYCNSAFTEMCQHAREELIGASPSLLQGPETDTDAARSFVEQMERQGRGGTTLLNYKGDGTPYYVEIMAVRCPTPGGLEVNGESVFVAFERSLGDLEPGREGQITRPYRLALLLENVMRRYLQRNYHRGLHPAQWSALRYFDLAGPNQRTLSDFARSHRTTMGTASTTVSTLVGKGYLIKRGFRGPIELTDDGRALLRHDPLDEVADTLAQLDSDGSQWTEHVLLKLAERLDSDGDADTQAQA